MKVDEPIHPDQINAQAQGSNLLKEPEQEAEDALTGPTVVLNEISGDVQVRQTDQEDFSPAIDGDLLYRGGQVQTGEEGRVRLDFSDGTLVRVGPNSMFTLEGIDESNDGLLKSFFMQFGQLWIILRGGELEVDSPSGLASVRGSFQMILIDPISGDVYTTCLEGICTLELNGEIVTYGTGETAWITGGQPPQSGFMTEEEIQAWLDNNPEAALVKGEVLSSIGNFVWEDLNGNGLQEFDEQGIEGVSVTLLNTEDGQVATTITDEDGYYLFEDLMPGEYSLEFFFEKSLFTVQDAGDDDTLDNDADQDGQTEMFYLPPGTDHLDADAGILYPGHAGICPLTGLPTDADKLELRPIFISMSIFPAPATRPSTGVNSAPVIFETLIDEGQTRLQTLFYCGYPEKLPVDDSSSNDNSFDIRGVRSGRVFYAELAQLFGAGLIFGGADATVYQTIAPYQCALADNQTPGDIGGAGVDIDQLQEIADRCKHRLGNTDLNVWTFGPPPTGGMSVKNFLMHYNHLNQTRWIYDPKAGGYVRYQNDPANPEVFTLSTDRLTGEAVVRQNIILLQVPHDVLNSSGTVINFDLTDERGYAWLLRDGAMHKACWSAVFDDYETMSNRYRPFLLMDCQTKEPVNFAYGSTWVNIVAPSFWFEQKGEYYMAKQPFIGYGP
jgi:hypothetical protein